MAFEEMKNFLISHILKSLICFNKNWIPSGHKLIINEEPLNLNHLNLSINIVNYLVHQPSILTMNPPQSYFNHTSSFYTFYQESPPLSFLFHLPSFPPTSITCRTLYKPPSPSFYESLPQSLTPQPSGFDAFFTLPNMDDRTRELRRMYNELKVEHFKLFMSKEVNVFFKVDEERLKEIEGFTKAFIDYVLWIKNEEGVPWSDDFNDEGTKVQKLNATSQVENSIFPVPILAKYVKKQVHFQLPKELL